MGEYATRLNVNEYENFIKEIKTFLINNDLKIKDLANATGYSIFTVYGALSDYNRCGRFFVASVIEWMENYEKSN